MVESRKAIYLVVADKTDEFSVALRYATRAVAPSGAHVGILYIMESHDFVHWGEIEKRMRQEIRQEAEQILWNHARRVYELNGQIPALYINHGHPVEALTQVIDEDPNIKQLILASADGSAPGPLVSHFTTKGLQKLRVPVTIVPGHIEPQDIDNLA